MTTKVTKSGVGAIDQLSTGSVKHKSSPVDNITLDANGRVGIGTSSPNENLTVVASTGGTGGIRVETQYGQGYFGNYNNYPAMMYNSSGLKPVIFYDTNNHITSLYTNSIERMRIDSAGRMTMPYQPAFFAAIDGGSANAIITNWGWVDTNIGNHFDATTGAFTAPITGTYLFFANIMTGGSSYHYFHFRKNTGTNIGSYHHTAAITSGYRHSSGCTIATLAANDTVSIFCGNAGPYTSGPNRWSGFGGYLLG